MNLISGLRQKWTMARLSRLLAAGLWMGCATGTLLPMNARAEDASTDGETATVAVETAPIDVEKAIEQGVEFLIKAQNANGSWGSALRTKDLNIFAPAPGAHRAFRCGTSALCVEALVETGAYQTNPRARAALEKGEEWLLENLPRLRRADTIAIYNVWGHSYGIQALAAMYRRDGQDEARKQQILEAIAGQIKLLAEYESVDGGWGYYDFKVGSKRPTSDSTSFTTATALLAFDKAKNVGVPVPEGLSKRAVDSVQRQRKEDNSYLYGEYLKWRPMRGINRPAGSLGRSQVCNLALRRWGDKTVTDEVLAEWLDRLITRNGWLSIGRKRPVPHESWFQVAGYFFYYGHYYAALCVEELGPEKGDRFKPLLASIVGELQEKDGSWWDYPLYDYHQPYGTAFALMTLHRCRP